MSRYQARVSIVPDSWVVAGSNTYTQPQPMRLNHSYHLVELEAMTPRKVQVTRDGTTLSIDAEQLLLTGLLSLLLSGWAEPHYVSHPENLHAMGRSTHLRPSQPPQSQSSFAVAASCTVRAGGDCRCTAAESTDLGMPLKGNLRKYELITWSVDRCWHTSSLPPQQSLRHTTCHAPRSRAVGDPYRVELQDCE